VGCGCSPAFGFAEFRTPARTRVRFSNYSFLTVKCKNFLRKKHRIWNLYINAVQTSRYFCKNIQPVCLTRLKNMGISLMLVSEGTKQAGWFREGFSTLAPFWPIIKKGNSLPTSGEFGSFTLTAYGFGWELTVLRRFI
jgi:hypothetical protein